MYLLKSHTIAEYIMHCYILLVNVGTGNGGIKTVNFTVADCGLLSQYIITVTCVAIFRTLGTHVLCVCACEC